MFSHVFRASAAGKVSEVTGVRTAKSLIVFNDSYPRGVNDRYGGGVLVCRSSRRRCRHWSNTIFVIFLVAALLTWPPEHQFLPADEPPFLERRRRLVSTCSRTCPGCSVFLSTILRAFPLRALFLLLPLCPILCGLRLRSLLPFPLFPLELSKFSFLFIDE